MKAGPRGESAVSGARRKDAAASHGLQRWQQGYHLREVTREWASQYFQIQQDEAAGHVREMERHLAEVREREASRVELFRQAANDLRGNVGVVRNATVGLRTS